MAISGAGSPLHFDVLQSKSNPRIEAILPISDLIIVEASINDNGHNIPMETEMLLQGFRVRAQDVPVMYIEVGTHMWDVERENRISQPTSETINEKGLGFSSFVL